MNNEQIKVGKFLFMQDWPEELLPTIRALAEEFQWFVPTWCHHVIVVWSSGYENPMTCEVNTPYRNIRLRVGPNFFDDSDEHRREMFIHELIHGFIANLADYTDKVVVRALDGDENAAVKKLIREDLNERHEQATNDLAFVLARKLK